MTLSATSIQTLQNAGQAVDNARIAFIEQTRQLNERVAFAMANNPFALENDGLYEAWKRASRISHDLAQIDTQLRGLFGAACELAETLAPAAVSGTVLQLAASVEAAQTVTDVEPKLAPVKRQYVRKNVLPVASGKPTNAALLTRYLRQTLNRKTPKRLTMSQMGQACGITSGSIHAAVKAVLDAGTVIRHGAGRYTLA